MPRQHWALDPDVTYLDHGAFGACPLPVLAEQSRLRGEMERQPSSFFMSRLEGLLDDARGQLAAFVGAAARDLVFVQNATAGVNAILRALPLRDGDEVLVTNHGYSGVQKAVQYAMERTGARIRVVEVPFPISSPAEVVDRIERAVTARTRLAIVDHVTSPTALVWPIEEIVQRLRARSVEVLVDGAHAPGMIPLDLRAVGAAYYVAAAHKWLCAPKGAAFMWVRSDMQQDVHPTSISHGYKSFRDDRSRFHLEFDWIGTADPTPYLSIPSALSFLEGLLPGGWPELFATNRRRALAARDVMCEALGCAHPAPDSVIGAMVSVPIREARDEEYGDDFTTDPLHRRLLAEHAIDAQVIAWPEWPKRVLRISAQAYNTDDQFERLAAALRVLGMTSGA